MSTEGAFVGRAAELNVVASAIAGGTSTKALLVSGEAGIGKSRLLREATALDCHVRILRAACLPLTVDMPLLPIAEALRTAIALDSGWVEDALDSCPAFVRDAVGRVLPELADGTPDLPPTGDPWWLQRLMTGIRSLLAAMAGSRPLCVVIEDLQWADSTTLDYLEMTLSDPGHGWILSWRSDDPATPQRTDDWRSRVSRLPTVGALELSPLSKQETAAQLLSLTGRPAVPTVVEEIFRRGQGNPLFTEQLANASGGSIPLVLEKLVTARFSRLGPAAQEVGRVLAAIGRRTSADELTLIVPAVEAANVRELREARLLHPDEGSGLMLRHALLGDAILGEMLPTERAQLHLRVARVLETLAAPNPGELAEHWRHAGDMQSELRWRREAADQAKLYSAPAQRAVHLLRAIELEDPADLPTLARLYAEANEALTNSNQPRAAAELAERSMSVLAHAAPATRMATLARIAQHRGLTDPAGGMEVFSEALTLLDQSEPGPEALWFLSRYANLAILTGDYALAATISKRGLDMAVFEGADPGPRKRLHATRAAAARYGGNLAEVMPALADMVGVGATPNPLDDIFCSTYAATVLEGSNDEAEGIRLSVEALMRWTALGLPEVRGTSVTRRNIAQSLLDSGRVTEAATWIDPATEGDPERDHVLAHLMRAELDLARGETVAARQRHGLLSDFVPLSQWYLTWAQVGTEIALWSGDPIGALKQAYAMFDRLADASGSGSTAMAWTLATRAAADAADQTPAQRADLNAEIRTFHDLRVRAALASVSHDRLDAAAELAQAQAELARLNGDDTPELWQMAAAGFADARRPLRTAYCLWRQATALLRVSGRTEQTREVLVEQTREVLVEAEELGSEYVPLMASIADTAKRARITLGNPAATDVRQPESPLTARELDVVRLVADGLTNAEIAARLFMSPKTASVHVSNVMRKLGANSRTQAATAAQRAGLLD